MKELSKRICITTFLSFMSLTQGCTELSGLFSSSKSSSTISKGNSPNNDSFNNPKEVRGPTGGGTGGGIIIVDSSGQTLKNKRFDLYIQENGFSEKIQSGYTDSDGRLSIDQEILAKIESGEADFVVEVYDGAKKTLARAEIDYSS